MKQRVLVVQLLVCGLCVAEHRPVRERFRTSDSKHGRDAQRRHAEEEHGK